MNKDQAKRERLRRRRYRCMGEHTTEHVLMSNSEILNSKYSFTYECRRTRGNRKHASNHGLAAAPLPPSPTRRPSKCRVSSRTHACTPARTRPLTQSLNHSLSSWALALAALSAKCASWRACSFWYSMATSSSHVSHDFPKGWPSALPNAQMLWWVGKSHTRTTHAETHCPQIR